MKYYSENADESYYAVVKFNGEIAGLYIDDYESPDLIPMER